MFLPGIGALWEAFGEPVAVRGVLLTCPVGPALFSAPGLLALSLVGFLSGSPVSIADVATVFGPREFLYHPRSLPAQQS